MVVRDFPLLEMAIQSYLRVKRQKQTYFVDIKLLDTVLKLKNQLSVMLFKERLPKEIRLQIPGKTAGQYTPLEDTAILEQVGLADEGVVYMCLWIPHQSNFISRSKSKRRHLGSCARS